MWLELPLRFLMCPWPPEEVAAVVPVSTLRCPLVGEASELALKEKMEGEEAEECEWEWDEEPVGWWPCDEGIEREDQGPP